MRRMVQIIFEIVMVIMLMVLMDLSIRTVLCIIDEFGIVIFMHRIFQEIVVRYIIRDLI